MSSVAHLGRFQFRVEKSRREQIRWLCLRYIDQARPSPMTVTALLSLIQSIFPDASEVELQRSLDYLELRGLLTVGDRQAPSFPLKLTYQGIDFVDFTIPELPGIGRPAIADQ